MCADIVSSKLSKILNIPDNINEESLEIKGDDELKNPLTNQPIYSSSLITAADVAAFKEIEENIGLEDFSKIILMKVAQKSMNDHAELVSLVGRVDDNKAARMSEVAQIALGNSLEAAKTLLNLTLQKEKMEIEKQKLQIKSVVVNNLNIDNNAGLTGTHKEILDKLQVMMNGNGALDDDVPPLLDV